VPITDETAAVEGTGAGVAATLRARCSRGERGLYRELASRKSAKLAHKLLYARILSNASVTYEFLGDNTLARKAVAVFEERISDLDNYGKRRNHSTAIRQLGVVRLPVDPGKRQRLFDSTEQALGVAEGGLVAALIGEEPAEFRRVPDRDDVLPEPCSRPFSSRSTFARCPARATSYFFGVAGFARTEMLSQ